MSKAKTSSPTTPKGEAVVEEKVEAVVDDKVAELSETQVESDVAGEPADDVVKEEVEEPEPADVSETPEEQVKPEVEDAEPAKTEPEKKEDVPEDEKTLESVPDISKDAPLKAESVDDDSDDTPKLEKKNKKIFIIGVLLAGVLLLSTVALGFYFFGGQDTVEETAVEVEEAEEEPAPTLEITELVREDWTIEVLNGSGVAGAAGELQEKLEDLGYEVLEVGNADNSDYEETEVYISSDMIDEADAFIEDLEEELDIVADPQELDDEEAPAVVRIIIGSE